MRKQFWLNVQKLNANQQNKNNILLYELSDLKDKLMQSEKIQSETTLKYEEIIKDYQLKLTSMLTKQDKFVDQIKQYEKRLEDSNKITSSMSNNHDSVLMENSKNMNENKKLSLHVHQLEQLNVKYERDIVIEREKMRDFKRIFNELLLQFRDLTYQVQVMKTNKQSLFN